MAETNAFLPYLFREPPAVAAWRLVDEPWARDGMPDDPAADAAEALQEHHHG
jgi:hypothetical protein